MSTRQPVTVTITTSGVSVSITATGDRRRIAAEAQRLHQEAHARCVAVPPGHGGAL